MEKPKIEDFEHDKQEVLSPDGSFRCYSSSSFDEAMAEWNREEHENEKFIQMLMCDSGIGKIDEEVNILIYRITQLKKFQVDQLVAFFALRNLNPKGRNQAIKKVLQDREANGVNENGERVNDMRNKYEL